MVVGKQRCRSRSGALPHLRMRRELPFHWMMGAFAIFIVAFQAEQFIEQYFRVFSGVRAWLDRTRAEATRTGVVSTLTGRRRPPTTAAAIPHRSCDVEVAQTYQGTSATTSSSPYSLQPVRWFAHGITDAYDHRETRQETRRPLGPLGAA